MNHVKLVVINAKLITAIAINCIGSLISLVIPLFIQKMIDGKHFWNLIINPKYEFAIFGLFLISSIINSISEYLISLTGDQQIKKLRYQLQKKILTLPIGFFDQNTSGELVSRITNDTLIIKDFSTVDVPSAIVNLMTLLGAIAFLIYLNLKLTLVILAGFGFICLIAYPLGKINERYSFRIQTSLSEASQILAENTNNINLIKLHNAQNQVLDHFDKKLDQLYRLSKRVDAIFSITGPIQTFLTLTVILAIIWFGIRSVATGSITAGVLTSFLMYMFEMITPINGLGNFYLNYTQAKGASVKLNQFFKEKEEQTRGAQLITDLYHNNRLSLKNIYFSYSNEKQVLKNITMTFYTGTVTAIVGPSGAGKTTLINLLTRLLIPNAGTVELNDRNAQLYALSDWRNFFSVVSQTNDYLYGTIKENLTLGLDSSPSDQQIMNALKWAGLDQEIADLPYGINTNIGERGVRFSAGQRQRLQLARAYLRNTPCLILDEATANLDPESEYKITQAIDFLSKDKIVIVIAHRMSTIVNADKIYFLDDKTIQGVGTHQELLRKVPKYLKFVKDQIISVKG